MIKRWQIYCREMYPFGQSVMAAFLLSGALYFLTVLTCFIPVQISVKEVMGALTVYGSLLFLRIADDFKDEELDRRLFAGRPYPSGRVKKRDLQILAGLDCAVMIVGNILFESRESLWWFAALMIYMFFMCVWFFQKKRIQSNLILALVTHNPCMILMNYYILSITCSRYGLKMMTWDFFCINLMLYFPALEYEISRKIKAPSAETEYVTYSKLLGLKKAVILLSLASFIELLATEYIAWMYFPRFWCVVFAGYYLVYGIHNILYVRYAEKPGWNMGMFARGYIVVMQGTLIAVASACLYLYS